MNIEDLPPGAVIEFIHPVSKKPDSGKFGVGTLVQIIHRKTGSKPTDIIVENSQGDKTRLRENNIRWDRTEYHLLKEK